MAVRQPLTLPKLTAKAQTIFNRWVRNRDEGKPCVSCGSWNTEQASHFYSAGQYTALRFTEDNVHLACKKCNYFLSGNLIPYRIELEKRIGKERLTILDAMATRHRTYKWSRFELEEIIKKYK